jgi:hypothetical protein
VRKIPVARSRPAQSTVQALAIGLVVTEECIDAYFKRLAEEAEVPYQTLINLFLRDCARGKKPPSMLWEAA